MQEFSPDLLVMRPHAKNFNGANVFENLINKTMLKIDPA